MDLFGKTYHKVFILGVEPKDIMNRQFISTVAKSYNKDFHDAPVWIGHPLIDGDTKGDKEEPKALAWVDGLLALGDELFASYSYISDELKYYAEMQYYKYVSCEFVYYDINGIQTPYLFAIGITNRPACKGLEPMKFTESVNTHKFNTSYLSDKIYNSEILNNNFINQNINIMNQYLINAAKAAGIEIKSDSTEDSIANAVIAKFNEINGKVIELNDKIKNLGNASGVTSEELKNFTEEINKLKAERNLSLVESAISSGKALANQKEALLKFAESDYDSCKKYIETLPVSTAFAGKTINDGNFTASDINFTDKKFLNPKTNMPYTYAEVIKDNALMKQFTDAEIIALKAKQ